MFGDSSAERRAGAGERDGEGGAPCAVRVGEDAVQCERGFRLFFATPLRAPPLRPALASRVALVNFTITRTGLEEALLSSVVEGQRPSDAARLAALGVELSAAGAASATIAVCSLRGSKRTHAVTIGFALCVFVT